MGAENIKVEPMKVIYGANVAQVEKIICHADSVATPLNNKYIKVYTPAGVIKVFWFNVNSGGTAPTVPGATLIEVAIATSAAATAVASALQAEIDGEADLVATVSGEEVTVTQSATGYASAIEDSPVAPTLFGLQIITQGDTQAEIGCIDGDIEIAFEETFQEVKCHDTGTVPVTILKTGVSNVEVTFTALETTKAKMKPLFVKSGGSFTPVGGTDLFGMGTFKNFENVIKFASKLRLHPVRLLDGDQTEDWTFHKAFPKLEGITFSGENPLTLPVTFEVFPAEGVNKRINYFCIGDGSQSLV